MIKLKDVWYRYAHSENHAVSSTDIRIRKGEFILLCGKSGCGKTTITRLINGIIPNFHEGMLEGKVYLQEKLMFDMKMEAISSFVGSVFQDPRSQFFTMNTTSEMAFFCENLGMKRQEMINRLSETIKALEIEPLINKSIFNLSSGEKQKIAIASVYAASPNIYVLDEPSSNLDQGTIQDLKKILMMLKEKGHTVIIAEHRLHYLVDIADRIILMDKGTIQREYTKTDFLALSEREKRVLGLRSICLNTLRCNNKLSVNKTEEKNLIIENLCFNYKNKAIFNSCHLRVNAGEIVGIIGKNGVGKSTLAHLICGLLKEKSGSIIINGRKVKANKRTKKTCFVGQESDYQLFTDSVMEELKLGNKKGNHLNDEVNRCLSELGLSDYKEHHPAALSSGQKQRVTIASAIIKDTDIIVLDEPTSGLDAENMYRVSNIIKKLAENGKMVIIVTHDYEFILNTCTRLATINNGTIDNDFELNDSNVRTAQKMLGLS